MNVSKISLWGCAALLSLSSCGNSDGGGFTTECPDGPPYFTVSPIALDAIKHVIVLGQINPPGDVVPRGQTGFSLNDGASGPVVAPGEIRIDAITSNEYLVSPGRQGEIDYQLRWHVEACPAITGVLGHVKSLDPSLADEFTGNNCYSYSTDSETVEKCESTVGISLKAGDPIGSAMSPGLDMDLYDYRVTHPFISPERLSELTHRAVCFQDLFTPELRDSYYALTGRAGVMRTAAPRCGTMEVDIAGTAQGLWIREGQEDAFLDNDGYTYFLILAPDDVDPENIQVIGSAEPTLQDSRLHPFSIRDSGRINRKFSEVPADGSIHCYKHDVGEPLHVLTDLSSFFVALAADGTLTIENIEHAEGNSPCDADLAAWAFSAKALKYVR